jgi:site-specific recombinase XerD
MEGFEDLPLFSKLAKPAEEEPPAASELQPSHSLSAAICAWEEALRQAGNSPNTIKAFGGDLRLLAKFVGSGQAVNAIGTHDVKNFLDWMLNRRGVPCSPKTYARRITSIKAFFRWLAEGGQLPANIADPIPQQTVLSPLPEVLSIEEREKALQVADEMRRGPKGDARPFVLLALLLETGIKKGECLAIHRNHIDLSTPQGPTLFVRYDHPGKRYKERKLPLSQEWVTAYREYLAQYNPQERLFPWSPRRLEYLLEEIGEKAALEKHLSFDMCRWTAALHDYLAGAERDKIRQKMGISKVQFNEIGNKLDRLAVRLQSSLE